LARIPGASTPEDGRWVFASDGEVTFYFGRDGERIVIARVREARLVDEWLELDGHRERAFFPCEELVGLKAVVTEVEEEGRRAGFGT